MQMYYLKSCLVKQMVVVKGFLSKYDYIRYCAYLGDIRFKKWTVERADNEEKLKRLSRKRYGHIDVAASHVRNLSSYKLSAVELDVLSRGPKFGILPRKLNKEDIFFEFKMFWSQLGKFQPNDSEAVPGFKSKLSSLAHVYSECKVDSKEFSLTKEHMIALSNLNKNKNIVICKPDKGSGVVILDREDYNSKMLNILKDNNKFCALGKLPECDKTSTLERRLQTLLLNLKKSNQINETFYNLVRPTGAERRMYGLPKIHKEGAPLRPILAMINSAQHELAKQLSVVLSPVLERFSTYALRDSFTFTDELKQQNFSMHSNLTVCSFDVTSLFTNVPLEETIEICAQNLFHSDMTLPDMSENAFRELMMAATKGVEFSFDDNMYKHIDGVAMGSPLGPVLANIFVGYHECIMLASSDCPDVL
ncbi:uncharacterized protein LOC124437935 [Xenia sp. Carnegie-2017]|uniref:uncharacterized protein LOC124437935 n=1 Tax=Xenia sp. Carnegie-2017 TaxID=2897299 RepID=UPI001F045E50|nr:uncharacterized protein LOC124437935 [Xenia sp. Carnegie-2017]